MVNCYTHQFLAMIVYLFPATTRLRVLLPGLFVFLSYGFAAAQSSGELGRKGDSAYSVKNYPLAVHYYQQQAALQPFSFLKQGIYYNMACCYALNGDKKNALQYLDESIKAGYNDYAHILTDSDLDALHGEKKWAKFTKLSKASQQRLSDPAKAELVTTDIHHFWETYDRVQKDTAHAAELYTKYYFEEASPGLQDYFTLRIYSVKNFVANQKRKPAFYRAIRQNTLKVDEFKSQIKASFVKLKQIYDAAIFPNVYFVIGCWNSAGTVSGNGMLIGTDMLSKSDDVPQEELNLWEKNNYKSIDNLPYLVAHELGHIQQDHMKQDTTTLSACIREGLADFIGELISGKNADERVAVFARGKEKLIWKDFEKEMYLNRSHNWVGNSEQERPDHPADIGYWVGYAICKSYYEEMPDKKQAIYDMLHIQDYRNFLRKSRYIEKLGL